MSTARLNPEWFGGIENARAAASNACVHVSYGSQVALGELRIGIPEVEISDEVRAELEQRQQAQESDSSFWNDGLNHHLILTSD